MALWQVDSSAVQVFYNTLLEFEKTIALALQVIVYKGAANLDVAMGEILGCISSNITKDIRYKQSRHPCLSKLLIVMTLGILTFSRQLTRSLYNIFPVHNVCNLARVPVNNILLVDLQIIQMSKVQG